MAILNRWAVFAEVWGRVLASTLNQGSNHFGAKKGDAPFSVSKMAHSLNCRLSHIHKYFTETYTDSKKA
ncbi:MAG: hypothetical protein CL917_02390 [Deltaproteobacteria bacterium]|nr:hypothetical protein [Deltaproteobacteria bacterium]